MQIRKLDGNFAISEQITTHDVAAIAAAGYRAIICNRPDNEGFGQTNFAEIEAAARAAGLQAAHIPVVPGQMVERDIKLFAELMRSLPGPVLGYCKSGARAAGMWQAAQSVNQAG